MRDFFEGLVWRRFIDHVHLDEPSVTQYVSDMLVAFVHVDNLYRIRNAQGRRLEDVGEMLTSNLIHCSRQLRSVGNARCASTWATTLSL